ncbi:hypothetical protein DVR12_17750 [Chitinophaga silvatica]|uniref:MafI family immunity protein n=1 Tax=Chitinophaga silvatica TaxID=2282649 RepID=A0A3E1Y8H9_9BACT|nr:hypothetical protein [Chitinophaga silvatica]RFS21178.1 hypothetical protein DVR12_17750 [Chitinophaga silvatica]
MEVEKIDWQFVTDFIVEVLSKVQVYLDQEAINTITMYLTYDEYEMAFEILYLKIMELQNTPPINLAKSLEVGKLLKLDEYAVFDGGFWNKFEHYIIKHQ